MTEKTEQAARNIRRALELLAHAFNPPHAPVPRPIRLADLLLASADDLDLRNAELRHTWLRGIDFGNSRLGDLSHSILDAALLESCELAPEALAHTHLIGTKLPDGLEPPPSAFTELPAVPPTPILPLGHAGPVKAVDFSPDGRLLASGAGDETLCLWDLATGKPLSILVGHDDWVLDLAFSPDGRLLVSGSHDRTLRLWNPATGEHLRILEGHGDSVTSVAFSPDGRLLASGSQDKTLRLWDPATGKPLLRTLEGHDGPVLSIDFSPDGRLLASGSRDKTLRLWNPGTDKHLHTLEGHRGEVNSVAFSRDGLLASGSGDKTLRLWDPATGKLLHTLKGHGGWVESVAFSPDGRLLASGSSGNTLRLWEPTTGKLLHTLEGHGASVWSLAFSPDGTQLVSASHDGTIRLWDLGKRVCLRLIAPLRDGTVMLADAAGLYFSRNDGRPWQIQSFAGFPRPLPADPLLERLTGFVTEGNWVLPICSYPEHFRWDDDTNPRTLILPWPEDYDYQRLLGRARGSTTGMEG